MANPRSTTHKKVGLPRVVQKGATKLPASSGKAQHTQPAAPKLDLSKFRHAIDAIDQRLIRLLRERSELVVGVGKAKQAQNIPIYAPHREAEVLERVLRLNQAAGGLLAERTIEGIWREIMSGSIQLERPVRIGYLGPMGSFSHMAAVKHFGSSVSFENLHEIAGVFTEVKRGHVDYGLVPIENSAIGGIGETLDQLVQLSETARGKGQAADRLPVHICAEVQMAVHHTMMANCEPAKVTRIFSKPEVLSQCRVWLAHQYPKAELIPAASSSRAVQMVAEESEKMPPGTCASAAIGSKLASELYGVSVLFDRIEDNPGNVTRFFVIGRHTVQPSGKDKTTVMFTTLNKPGALARVLSDFERAGVNLTHIDKRPSGRKNFSYTFFIDAEGHMTEKPVAHAIAKSQVHCKELVVLGSFPASQRIL